MRKYNQKILGLIGLWSSFLLLASCGGGGGRITGIDGSGSKPIISVTGPINGFGSVIVNGVHYDTTEARIFVRGQPADETDLRVGDYVTLMAGTNEKGDAIAYEVHYQPRVTGAIELIDKNNNQFTVLGQTVQLLEDTVYDSALNARSIDALKVGTHLSVSGTLDSDQILRATRIALDASPFVELAGRIEAYNPYARQFKVNGQTIIYSPALFSSKLSNGQFVVVQGEITNNQLLAQKINFSHDYRQLKNIKKIELSGFLYKSPIPDQFVLDFVPVKINSETVFKNASRSALAANTKVRVVGALDEQDFLVVREIEILSTPTTQVYGEIQLVYPWFGPWGSLGFVKVQDQDFEVRVDTRITGDFEKRINFQDLRIGDRIYISGYARDNHYIATSLAVDNRELPEQNIELQGIATYVSAPLKSFSIFATRVTTSSDTTFRQNSKPLSEFDFYKKSPNVYVRARGQFKSGLFKASEVQLVSPELLLIPQIKSQPGLYP